MNAPIAVVLAIFLSVVGVFPQKEGSAFTQKALKEISDRMLIPANARIQKVSKLFLPKS